MNKHQEFLFKIHNISKVLANCCSAKEMKGTRMWCETNQLHSNKFMVRFISPSDTSLDFSIFYFYNVPWSVDPCNTVFYRRKPCFLKILFFHYRLSSVINATACSKLWYTGWYNVPRPDVNELLYYLRYYQSGGGRLCSPDRTRLKFPLP